VVSDVENAGILDHARQLVEMILSVN
jgi:hypothetical protein